MPELKTLHRISLAMFMAAIYVEIPFLRHMTGVVHAFHAIHAEVCVKFASKGKNSLGICMTYSGFAGLAAPPKGLLIPICMIRQ